MSRCHVGDILFKGAALVAAEQALIGHEARCLPLILVGVRFRIVGVLAIVVVTLVVPAVDPYSSLFIADVLKHR